MTIAQNQTTIWSSWQTNSLKVRRVTQLQFCVALLGLLLYLVTKYCQEQQISTTLKTFVLIRTIHLVPEGSVIQDFYYFMGNEQPGKKGHIFGGAASQNIGLPVCPPVCPPACPTACPPVCSSSSSSFIDIERHRQSSYDVASIHLRYKETSFWCFKKK